MPLSSSTPRLPLFSFVKTSRSTSLPYCVKSNLWHIEKNPPKKKKHQHFHEQLPPVMPDDTTTPAPAPSSKTRLAQSGYLSPYSHAGAPKPHPNTDVYAALRATALASLEAMGFDPSTMVERGVVWAEDQDPFGHVMHSQYMHFLGTCFHRFMESYDEILSEQEYEDMINAKTVVPAIRRYELDIRRQVKYPDSVRIDLASPPPPLR